MGPGTKSEPTQIGTQRFHSHLTTFFPIKTFLLKHKTAHGEMHAEVFQVKKWFDEGKHHIHILLENRKTTHISASASCSDESMLAKEIKTQSTAVATDQDNFELVSVTQKFPGSVQLFMPMKDTLPFLQSKPTRHQQSYMPDPTLFSGCSNT